MKTKIMFCLSLIQTGPASLSTPESVLNLAKKNISQQLNKNFMVEAQFDSAHCAQSTTYEIFSEGIKINKNEKIFHSNLFINYQDIIEDQKIPFPIYSDNLQVPNTNQEPTITKAPLSLRPIWMTIGVGILGAAFLFNRVQSEKPNSSGKATNPTFVKTF